MVYNRKPLVGVLQPGLEQKHGTQVGDDMPLGVGATPPKGPEVSNFMRSEGSTRDQGTCLISESSPTPVWSGVE
jgi:hypothetical protein